MTRYGMAIDLSRCIGCNTCAVACKVSNNLPKDVWWNVVHTEGRDFADTSKGTYGGEMQLSWLPVNCMHCENAVCEEVCPTGATVKRDDGIVTVDEETCIGCKWRRAPITCAASSRTSPSTTSSFPSAIRRLRATRAARWRSATSARAASTAARSLRAWSCARVVLATGAILTTPSRKSASS